MSTPAKKPNVQLNPLLLDDDELRVAQPPAKPQTDAEAVQPRAMPDWVNEAAEFTRADASQRGRGAAAPAKLADVRRSVHVPVLLLASGRVDSYLARSDDHRLADDVLDRVRRRDGDDHRAALGAACSNGRHAHARLRGFVLPDHH